MDNEESKKELVTISCKIERSYLEKLDELTKSLGKKSRSEMIRKIVCGYIDLHSK